MKAYCFRLDPALRWRTTQYNLEREAVSRLAGRIDGIQNALLAQYSEMRSSASTLAGAGAVAFDSWAAYTDRCRRQIRMLDEQLTSAKKEFAIQTQKMMEAGRSLRVLENLERGERAAWERELSQEIEAFAAEAYLGQSNRKARMSTRNSRRTGDS